MDETRVAMLRAIAQWCITDVDAEPIAIGEALDLADTYIMNHKMKDKDFGRMHHDVIVLEKPVVFDGEDFTIEQS